MFWRHGQAIFGVVVIIMVLQITYYLVFNLGTNRKSKHLFAVAAGVCVRARVCVCVCVCWFEVRT